MGKFAYACLITSFATLIISAVVYALAVGGQMFIIGTPPGAIAAGIFGLVSFITGLAGVVLAVLHARSERFSSPSLVCLGLNGSYVVGIGLLVVASLFVQARQEAMSAKRLAQYELERRDEGVVAATRDIDTYLIGTFKQGVLQIPLRKLTQISPRTLSNGMKIVGIYLPASSDETRDEERSIIDRGMGKAVSSLVAHLVKRKQVADALIVLEAMEEATCFGHWKIDERSLDVKELRSELMSPGFTAGDRLEPTFGSEVIAGYLQGL